MSIDELRDDEEYSEILQDMREESGKFGKHMLSYMHINTLLLLKSKCNFHLVCWHGYVKVLGLILVPETCHFFNGLFFVSLLKFSGSLVNVIIPRPIPNGELIPGVGKVSLISPTVLFNVQWYLDIHLVLNFPLSKCAIVFSISWALKLWSEQLTMF